MASRQRLHCSAGRLIPSTSTSHHQQQQLRSFASSSRRALASEDSQKFSQASSRRNHLRPLRLSQHFSPTQKASHASSSSSSTSLSSATSSDDPLPSLQLLLRGGYIRSSSSGVFTLLPNALRIVRNITNIIDHELSAISASRLALPNLLPSRLWHQTGRYHVMGSELYKLRDRKDSEFILGPTHEEEITKLVAHEVDSDRQLPLRLYQITTKFRDEPRPRMGLLRTKEFLMKDLYSFDKSETDAIATYDEVRRAYARIFDRIFGARGRWKAADADTGAIGGNKSHEYHVEDSAGEDTLISCRRCEYVANTEKAVSMPEPEHMPVGASDVRVLLYGHKDVKVADQVMHAFVLPVERGLNETKLGKLVAKLNTANGQQQPVQSKMATTKSISQTRIELLHDSAIASSDQASSSMPVWDWKDRPEGPLVRFSSLSVLADFECASLDPSELNEALIEAVNAFTSRPGTSSLSGRLPLIDLFPTQFGHFASAPSGVTPPLTLVDIRTAQADDTCPSCKSTHSLKETKAIEIGHTFYLGERYSRALEAGFIPSNEAKTETDSVEKLPNGRVPFQMGCYGIGVSRILGALAQRAIDDFDRLFNQSPTAAGKGKKKTGFLWPPEIAPFAGVIVISDPRDAGKVQAAQDVWTRVINKARRSDSSIKTVLHWIVGASETRLDLKSAERAEDGWSTEQVSELVIDDRATTLGSKLAESEMTGYAFRIIVGKHWDAEGKVELQFVGERGWESVLLPLEAFDSSSSFELF